MVLVSIWKKNIIHENFVLGKGARLVALKSEILFICRSRAPIQQSTCTSVLEHLLKVKQVLKCLAELSPRKQGGQKQCKLSLVPQT